MLVFLSLALVAAAGVGFSFYTLLKSPVASDPVRVLTYSGFLAAWGPGPELAKLFAAKTGLKVEFRDGGDAGLLLKKLELFPSDVVVGLDQLSLPEAGKTVKWRQLPTDVAIGVASGLAPSEIIAGANQFVAVDWAPLAFIYRTGELEPPKSLAELADPRLKGRIALMDPRTSTPGLQFYFWVLDEMGVDEGLKFLGRLKENVHSVSGSWSQAYGLFTKKQAGLAFSYLTSPVYHHVQEKDTSYQGAVFPEGQPVQIEYAAIPEKCGSCDAAEKFVRFLLEPEAQKIIMTKNVMLPARSEVVEGTEFKNIPAFKIRPWKSLPALLEQREALFTRWQELGL